MQFREMEGRDPDVVIATNAGGGNLTGTARGLIKAGADDVKIYGASVNLKGLHMASDSDFNRKSFTTGHTGFGVPFATWPDRSDVPRSAARALRYMDRYVTVKQGEVFYITEMLAQIEGLERGPAGNTSLAAAFALASEFDEDEIIVVQETEYTGAGKHPMAQLNFAKENGIDVKNGDPDQEEAGKSVIIPEHPSQIKAIDVDLDQLKLSYLSKVIEDTNVKEINQIDLEFLADEINKSKKATEEILKREFNLAVVGG